MYCKNCAEILTPTDVACPKCGFALGTGIKFCEYCGSELHPGALNCDICGAAISTEPYNDPNNPAFQQQAAPQAYQQLYQQQQRPYQQSGYPGQPNLQQPYQQPMPYHQGQTYQQQIHVMQSQNVKLKSKVAAAILAFFLGSLGIHNFYLGKTAVGVIQLLMTTFSCGALVVFTEIWAIVEGILLLTGGIKTDGRNLPLQ